MKRSSVKDNTFDWSIHDPKSGFKGTSDWYFSQESTRTLMASSKHLIVVSGTYSIPMDRPYQFQLYDAACENPIVDNKNNVVRVSSTTTVTSQHQQALDVRIEIDSSFLKQDQSVQIYDAQTSTIDYCLRLDLLTQPQGTSVNFHESKFSMEVSDTANSNNNTMQEQEEGKVSCDEGCQRQQAKTVSSTTLIYSSSASILLLWNDEELFTI